MQSALSSSSVRKHTTSRNLTAILLITGLAWLPGTAFAASTSLTSYEANETTLSVYPAPGDTGLTVEIVDGGVNGAPPATDGARIVKLTITNEADQKVEYRHEWSAPHYDLTDSHTLTADVYIADSSVLPAVMGMYESAWDPPSAWAPADNLPFQTNTWTTISVDVSDHTQTGLDRLWAFVFQDLAGTSGVIYVDNLRLEGTTIITNEPISLNANGYAHGNMLAWGPVAQAGLTGFNIYRSTNQGGPFSLLDFVPADTNEYFDPQPKNNATRYFYYIAYTADGEESNPSVIVSALYNGLTDEELLDQIQWATFQYFWNGAHPVSGLTREGINTGHGSHVVTMGGSGFGLMAIIVGVERGWITRSAAADRLVTILSFLEDTADRFHGAWPHWMNGNTGATIQFGNMDDGADLVETAFLVQGMLTVRQYFDDPADPDEMEIRERITRMWEEVEWTWFRQHPGSDILYWHWSPNYDFAKNHAIRGYNETQIVYLLACASPTYPMPGSAYHNGWAGGNYTNGNSYYGILLEVGKNFGGPLFFTHYSNLGFDPRYKSDAYTNYFKNARNFSLIHHAHCTWNPNLYAGYGPFCWGLTASRNPWGYSAQSPTNDNGTITPTAALSAMPYTPAESLAALRHFYDVYGTNLLGTYGFKDAFNPTENWFDGGYLAIDQGPIVCMIENYRSGLLWKLFMQNPEIRPMMNAIGMYYDLDFNTDGNINAAEMNVQFVCMHGPDISNTPGCSGDFRNGSDLENDDDVDMADFAIGQTLAYDP